MIKLRKVNCCQLLCMKHHKYLKYSEVMKNSFCFNLMNRQEERGYKNEIERKIKEKFSDLFSGDLSDKEKYERVRAELEKDENQDVINTIIRDTREELSNGAIEEADKAQKEGMNYRQRMAFEERKKAEIERRKNKGKEEPKKNRVNIEIVRR
ncbi:hypothetical protein ABK040_015649 [Willaertia magna]